MFVACHSLGSVALTLLMIPVLFQTALRRVLLVLNSLAFSIGCLTPSVCRGYVCDWQHSAGQQQWQPDSQLAGCFQ